MSGSTVVIPTYNREALVGRAIRSALVWRDAGFDLDIIVVDDASQDRTIEVVERDFAREIGNGILSLVRLPKNRGTTAAKNAGVRASHQKWIIFLDSDDELLPSGLNEVRSAMMQHAGAGGLLFRCTDSETGELVGKKESEKFFRKRDIFSPGLPGETLIVVDREKFLKILFPEELRGCESLALKRLVCADIPVWLSENAARRYYQPNSERLSVGDGFRARYKYIGWYHLKLVRYYRQCGLAFAAKSASKAAAYGALHLAYSLRKALGQ